MLKSKGAIKSIKDIAPMQLKGKRIFVRMDFNVPIKNGRIFDDYKIVASLPTIKYLTRYGGRLILTTHLGEPVSREKKFSTRPIAVRLSELTGKKVEFISECTGKKVKDTIEKIKNGEIVLLENLRFEPGEKANDDKFAKSLASLADIYVNNAFAVSHRKHASVSAIKKYIPSYAGLLLETEIKNLSRVTHPQKPFITVMGGAKIGTKIVLLKKLSLLSDRILIGGALANNFFAAHGLEVGKSLVDEESIKFASWFKGKNIILPVDVITARSLSVKSKPVIKKVDQVEKTDMILDIGPKTIHLFSSFIKKANTILWNGPMGCFENDKYKHGTIAIATLIASRSSGKAFGVAGGGETIEALKMAKQIDYIDWPSTGGGATLSFLGGEEMPGLKGLIK